MRKLRVGGDDTLRVDVEPVAHRERDRLGLRQHAARAVDQCRLLVRRAHRRLRQHAHRSGAEVERQLLPDEFADVGRDRHRQVGGAECRGECLDARRGAAVGFAEHRAAAGAGEQPHHARGGDGTGGPEDAADRAVRSDRGPQRIAGIEARQAAAIERAAMRVEIPPRDAVHRERHRCVRAEQRSDGGGDRGQRRRLHRDDDRVLRAEFGGVVAGRQFHGDRGVGRFHRQAVGADRGEMRAPRNHGHIGTACQEMPAR